MLLSFTVSGCRLNCTNDELRNSCTLLPCWKFSLLGSHPLQTVRANASSVSLVVAGADVLSPPSFSACSSDWPLRARFQIEVTEVLPGYF